MRTFSLVLFSMLTACLALAQTSNTAPRNGVREYVFSVPAAQVWFDTNLDLQPGDRVHVVGGVIDCDGPRPTEKLEILGTDGTFTNSNDRKTGKVLSVPGSPSNTRTQAKLAWVSREKLIVRASAKIY